ncbi:MAG: hypothetical protein K5666_01240 [Bacilli bacterium]|nr:hypothetical protein [Bacilli bacterium]
MKKKIKKDNVLALILAILFVPVVLTIVLILDWDPNNAVIMCSIIGVIWLFAILIIVFELIAAKKHPNPYPLFYLIYYDDLIKYLRGEELFSLDNKLEAGFHLYIYQGIEKNELQAWYFTNSNFEDERVKGNKYYFNKEEFDSLDALINNKIPYFDGAILIEICDLGSVSLDEYKKSHPELNVEEYIEKLNSQLQ